MAHGQRIHMPGVLHYVVLRAGSQSRGNNGAQEPRPEDRVFQGDEDQREFLGRLSIALAVTRVRLHGFCLTERDVRLLLEPSDIALGKCIQYVCTYFAQWANRRRGRSGHLFPQRYHAVAIADRSLVRVVSRHLHRTPLAAKIARDWEGYAGSSLRCYIGADSLPWLTTHRILRMFSPELSVGRSAYRRYVSARGIGMRETEGQHSRPPEEFQIGDGKFLRWLKQQLCEDERRATLEQIVQATCQRMRAKEVDLVSPSRVRYLSLARAVVTWYATHFGVATLEQIGTFLHRDPSTLYYGRERYHRVYPEIFGLDLEEFLSAGKPFSEQQVRVPRLGDQ